MLNKLLVKVMKKFSYVQNLENKIEQLKALETRLRDEKGCAVCEKNNMLAELNKQDYKLKNLECALIDMIENPHMIFSSVGGGNRYVLIDKKVMKANKEREVKFSLMFPENKVKVEVRE